MLFLRKKVIKRLLILNDLFQDENDLCTKPFCLWILNGFNFSDNDPFAMIWGSFDRSYRKLSNGTKTVEDGYVSRKLNLFETEGKIILIWYFE